MFKRATNPTFTHPVKVRVPVDGGFEDQDFKATFRVIPIAELETFDLGTTAGSNKFLTATITRFDDIVDDAGAQVPYSDALRDEVIQTPYARTALVKAYFDATGGAARGN